jgi:hypothetical protein
MRGVDVLHGAATSERCEPRRRLSAQPEIIARNEWCRCERRRVISRDGSLSFLFVGAERIDDERIADALTGRRRLLKL